MTNKTVKTDYGKIEIVEGNRFQNNKWRFPKILHTDPLVIELKLEHGDVIFAGHSYYVVFEIGSKH